jgi:hypothetical protein
MSSSRRPAGRTKREKTARDDKRDAHFRKYLRALPKQPKLSATSRGSREPRKSWINTKYGPLAFDAVADLARAQDGYCAICGRHQSEFQRGLCIDHDHATGKIRGLLCFSCNGGLGQFADSIERLEVAIAYLKRHK